MARTIEKVDALLHAAIEAEDEARELSYAPLTPEPKLYDRADMRAFHRLWSWFARTDERVMLQAEPARLLK
jgi:hypothetical protein